MRYAGPFPDQVHQLVGLLDSEASGQDGHPAGLDRAGGGEQGPVTLAAGALLQGGAHLGRRSGRYLLTLVRPVAHTAGTGGGAATLLG